MTKTKNVQTNSENNKMIKGVQKITSDFAWKEPIAGRGVTTALARGPSLVIHCNWE